MTSSSTSSSAGISKVGMRSAVMRFHLKAWFAAACSTLSSRRIVLLLPFARSPECLAPPPIAPDLREAAYPRQAGMSMLLSATSPK